MNLLPLAQELAKALNLKTEQIGLEFHASYDRKPAELIIRFWNEPNEMGLRSPLILSNLWDATTGKETPPMMCVVIKCNGILEYDGEEHSYKNKT